MLFWKDPWLNDVSFYVRYSRIFYFALNKLATLAKMFSLGWEVKDKA